MMLNHCDTHKAQINQVRIEVKYKIQYVFCHHDLFQFYRVPFLELGEFRKARIMGDIPSYPEEGTEMNEENIVQYQIHSFEFIQRMSRPRMIKVTSTNL